MKRLQKNERTKHPSPPTQQEYATSISAAKNDTFECSHGTWKESCRSNYCCCCCTYHFRNHRTQESFALHCTARHGMAWQGAGFDAHLYFLRRPALSRLGTRETRAFLTLTRSLRPSRFNLYNAPLRHLLNKEGTKGTRHIPLMFTRSIFSGRMPYHTSYHATSHNQDEE